MSLTLSDTELASSHHPIVDDRKKNKTMFQKYAFSLRQKRTTLKISKRDINNQIKKKPNNCNFPPHMQGKTRGCGTGVSPLRFLESRFVDVGLGGCVSLPADASRRLEPNSISLLMHHLPVVWPIKAHMSEILSYIYFFHLGPPSVPAPRGWNYE